MAVTDDMFFQYAAKADEEAKRASASGNFTTKQYDDIQYTGLQTNVPHIFRMVGGPPNSNVDGTTARTVTIAWIIGDDGKKFRCIRPSIKEDSSFFLNKVLLAVRKTVWNNGTKSYPVQERFPEIFNMVEHNGLRETDKGYIFDNGWMGKEKLVLNVIDRENMDLHRTTKHTNLLAKSVSDKGYADDGVSAARTIEPFTGLFRTYGSWEKYDVSITRHPSKDNTYEIHNVSRTPEVAPDYLQKFIVEGPLTDEELSWERYDLSKIYHYTTATKIYNRLKGKIARIDAALGTSFLKELEGLVEKERAEWEANSQEAAPAPATPSYSQPVVEPLEEDDIPSAPVQEAAPIRTRQAYVTKAPWETLPHPEAFPDEYKDKVLGYATGSDGKPSVTWNLPTSELAGCPDCGAASPLVFTMCPVCGTAF